MIPNTERSCHLSETSKTKNPQNMELWRIIYICAGFLITKPHSKLLRGRTFNMLDTWHFVKLTCLILVSAVRFKLLNSFFFLGIPEILWIKEMGNLTWWFCAGVKGTAGNIIIRDVSLAHLAQQMKGTQCQAGH